MFNSLKLKLLFSFFIINVIILSIYGTFIYNTAKKGVLNTTDTELKMISIDVIPDFQRGDSEDAKYVADELISEFSIEPLFVKIIHYGKNSKKIEHETLSSKEHEWLFDVPLNEIGHLGSIYYFNKKDFRVSSMMIFDKPDTKVFIQLALQKNMDSLYLKQLFLGLIIATPILLIVFLIIAGILINRTLLPVKGVISSVKSISANNLSNRVSTKEIPSEIKDLVATFNQLLNNLEVSFNKITDFSNNASHELKTPLTVIRGEIEVALKQDREPSEYKEILEDILQESISIQKMIEQLFFLAKKDITEIINEFDELYLDEVLTDTIFQLEKLAPSKDIHIEIKKIIPITIQANETLLKIAINNIIRNAILYSKNDSFVNISLDENSKEYLLIVEDNGQGIAKEDLEYIFERFYRADKTRSRKDGGIGLGLSIVKMILDIHHYDIEIKTILNVGTTVIVKIPKLNKATKCSSKIIRNSYFCML
ncbi:MAG: ATP-binding protein [Sulfurimonas sp.]|uniref:sensor histidine kinase n=1 Tax=Sulfurimonas sp. TaxID=2022749 RepID=UPI0025D57D0E|nr:ATP-binding protein [Sulfurimonas sp.]MCK9492092.1 ATP-binding protein [Sulfurimonas sp.]